MVDHLCDRCCGSRPSGGGGYPNELQRVNRAAAIGLRMQVEQNVFHNGSSSMAASPNTDSKAIAAFVETPNFTKIESLRFLGRGLSSTLLFDFSNFGSVGHPSL